MDDNLGASRRRLPGADPDDQQELGAYGLQAAARRDSAVHQARRTTNWTAAALIAGVAVTTGYFVHMAATPASPAGVAQHGTGVVTGQKPSVSHPVVVSGGSGVTAGSSSSGGGTSGGSVTWRDN